MTNELKEPREIRLPAHLCEAVEQMIKNTRFATVEQFLTFVMQELTSNSARSEEHERKVIEERLKDLGYL